MDDTPGSRSNGSYLKDDSGRPVLGSPLSDFRPRSPRWRRRRSVAVPLAVAALLVISLVIAVPAGISWARGRKSVPVAASAPTPAASSAAQVASESASAATETPGALASSEASSATQPDASAADDTSWQEQYQGKIVLGFRPEPGYKAVALTFDDGPNSRTKYVLKTLAEYGGRGTFFFSGTLLKRKGAAKHAVLVEEAESEVANHTMTHAIDDISAMWHRPYAFDVAQATGPDKLVKPLIGHDTLWLRPMGGNIDATGIRAANDTGHLVINWTIDSNDSHGGPRTPDYIYRQCTENVKSGDVILLHVTKKESMDALPRICAELERRGLKMVTVSELARHSTPISAKIPK